MKKILFIACVTQAILFTACKDKNTDEADIVADPFEACQLTEADDSGDLIIFNYNSEGMPSSMIADYYNYDCTYDLETEEVVCDSSKVSNELKFTYTGDQITGVQVFEDGTLQGSELLLAYDTQERLSKLTFNIKEDGDEYIDEYRFTYSNDNQITKVENFDNYSGDDFGLYGYEEYRYAGENVSQIDYYYESFNSRSRQGIERRKWFGNRELKRSARITPELEATAVLTHDDKINPLYGNIPFLLYTQSFIFFVSKNNFTSYKETEVGSNSYSYKVMIDYEYNSQDFPTLVKYTYTYTGQGANDEISQSIFSYDCK